MLIIYSLSSTRNTTVVGLFCRPQILMLAKLDEQLIPRYPNMFAFASQLKAGKGLIIAASVLEGDYLEKVGEVAAAKQVVTNTARYQAILFYVFFNLNVAENSW